MPVRIVPVPIPIVRIVYNSRVRSAPPMGTIPVGSSERNIYAEVNIRLIVIGIVVIRIVIYVVIIRIIIVVLTDIFRPVIILFYHNSIRIESNRIILNNIFLIIAIIIVPIIIILFVFLIGSIIRIPFCCFESGIATAEERHDNSDESYVQKPI